MNRYANLSPVKFLPIRKIGLMGLFCALSMATASCEQSEVSIANNAAEVADASRNAEPISPSQILQKPLAVGVDAKGVESLIVGSPIHSQAIAFQFTNNPVVSVQYKLISQSKDELEEITEKAIFGAIDGSEMTVSLPMFESCSVTEVNNVIEQLSGVCVRGVTVMLPANQEIAVYDATSYAAAGDLPFSDLAWPAQIPEDAAALGKTMSIDMDEFEYQLLLVERFVAAGKAKKFSTNDLWPLLNSVAGSSKKLAILARVAEPLKATYGSKGIPAADVEAVLGSLWEGDRAKAQSLLN